MMTYWVKAAFLVSVLWVGSLYAGQVSGTIKYDGKVPNFKSLKMDADPVCSAHHDTPVYPEVLVLGEGNTMGNVFVMVTNPPAGDYPVPAEPVVLDQKGCVYNPHVMGVRAGQEIKILNPDGTLHNVHALPKVNAEFNMAMPKFRKVAMKKFDKVESTPFPVKCDVHPWMTGWIAVLSHPFFAVTGKDGSFSIDGLAPGTYEISAWHEKLGTQTSSVTISAEGEVQTTDFTFKRG